MAVAIRFDANQGYQRDAIDSVVELFAGQEGVEQGFAAPELGDKGVLFAELVFGNSLDLAPETVRTNLRRVQDRPVEVGDDSLPTIAEPLRRSLEAGEMPLEFKVEMETGTGKTYVYLRTIAELHLNYGFRKFVVVVPSVAIREGVLNSLGLLREHIRDVYDGLQYDFHVYDSNALTRVRQFATASHLQIMVVNIAAMTGDANTRIIHRPTDAMNGYAPIEFLKACRPIVIMDEPQSLDGRTQGPAIDELQPLFRVGYSATPPDGPHLVYRLTPVDAYTQRLVKRIGVYSIVKDADPNEAYVEVTKVNATPTGVTATAAIHRATAQGTKQVRTTLRKDDDLFELSGQREIYRGWTVEDIRADLGLVEFGNGRRVAVASSSSEADDQHQKLMLRLAIESHFDKELELHRMHRRGVVLARIKPLTLFFIERVADYAPEGAKLRVWFDEEYEAVRADAKYRALSMPEVGDVHDGYFAVTNKGVAKDARADSKDAAGAFERIMQRKQELLGFDEPLRFIFSHSALAEGWDNPNVFTICHLQHGKSTMRKRQQVGRGLRLPVMENGERCHVDEVNVLTVIAKESFVSFAEALQREIAEETGVEFKGRIIDMRKKRTIRLEEDALESSHFVELWDRISPRTTYNLQFSTSAVVADAVKRIDGMPALEPVKFRLSKDTVEMGDAGLSGIGGQNRGEVVAVSARKIPDVVGELCRRLPLSRATIVRILKSCSRLKDVTVNAAVFIDQVAAAINQALYNQAAGGIVYSRTGETWSAALFEERHQEETVAPRVVAVVNSVADHVVCDSEVEERFAKFLDARPDVPLFLKLPEWFKVPTPLGNYNPDWAFVREEPAGPAYYLVRETKGHAEIEKLRFESEGWKIRFGQAHFDAIGVDYAFGDDPEHLILPSGARVIPFPTGRRVLPSEEVDEVVRFATHLPIYSLKAAAGHFGDGHDVDLEGWIEVDGRLDDTMFVSQVVGRSMEPRILDGSLCVFRQIRPGTRQGKIVLAQHRDIADPETGGSFTVKVYESSKVLEEGGVGGSITLRPLNRDYKPIVLTDVDETEVLVIAELVEVLDQVVDAEDGGSD
jgi:type III restriction enzyme